ncbi:TrmB family transcriptional regulator, partial [Halolamina litorea]
MQDAEAVEALTELGLSTYAARTFVGLQKLGVASASEVAGVTDVPRSQVYGAADELESLGLIDVQEGSPTRYRPVEIEEARELLYDRLQSAGDGAFEYLVEVREQHAPTDDRESIWTTEGRENVTARITSLIGDADDEVLFATGETALLTEDVAEALTAVAEDGVAVTVASAEPD